MIERLLERREDAWGPLEVVAQGAEIALRFGNQTAQSAWRPGTPDWLSFAYYRAMTLPLALQPHPARIGLLGLGGGVMARFLLEHTESSIHAVDLREELGELAERHFGLDRNHPRLAIDFADICQPDWQPPWSDQVDTLLIDLFDQDGMTRLPDDTVERLIDRLDGGGVVCINVWRNTMAAVVDIHRQFSHHLHQDALVAHIPERLNTVLIYRREPWTPADLEAGLKRMTVAPQPLRRAQAEAWQWLQPLRGQRLRP